MDQRSAANHREGRSNAHVKSGPSGCHLPRFGNGLWLPWIAVGRCEGDVTITNAQELQTFVDRGCNSVVGTLVISGSDLTSVSLPGLATASDLGFLGNPGLTNVNLPSLTTVSGHYCGIYLACWSGLYIDNNTALKHLSLPLLTRAVALDIVDNPALPQCQAEAILAQLVDVASSDISGNDTAATCP